MLTLLSQARRAGVRIDTSSDHLTFTGPDHLTRELETHREHIAYWLREGRVYLAWNKRPTIHHPTGCVLCCAIRDERGRHPKNCANCLHYRGRRPDPCVICRRTAHLVEAGRPVHKACAERHAWQLLQALLDTPTDPLADRRGRPRPRRRSDRPPSPTPRRKETIHG